MWIKCSERLPEKSGKYLIAKSYYGAGGRQWYYDTVHYSANHMQWNNFDELRRNESYDIYEVDYWMPIPEVEE